MEFIAFCPYCKSKLKKIPKIKSKCPNCGKFINSTLDKTTNSLVVITDIEAQKLRAIVNAKKRLSYFTNLHIDNKYFEDAKKNLSQKFGMEASDKDILWSVFSHEILNAWKKNDLQTAKMLQFDKAIYCSEAGIDYIQAMKSANESEIRILQQSDIVKGVKINACGCDECKKLDGKTFTFEEALKHEPLPNPNCTTILGLNNSYCSCMYSGIVNTDEELQNENKLDFNKNYEIMSLRMNKLHCPSCKKFKIRSSKSVAKILIVVGLATLMFGIGIIILLAGIVMMFGKTEYTCESCGFKWKNDKNLASVA